MTLHLQDKSGEIEAKFWTATKMIWQQSSLKEELYMLKVTS